MSDVASKRIARGKTWYNGTTINTSDYSGTEYEGTVSVWQDMGPSSSPLTPVSRRSAGNVVAVLVRNVSGGYLEPGRLVTWKSGYRGKRVDGYSCTTAGEVAGVVDEYLPATGVPNGDLFWLVVKGHSLVRNDIDGNAIAAGDVLVALTAATSGATAAGRVAAWAGTFTATQTTDGTLYKAIVNRIGRAVSAKTAGQTNALLLAEIDTHYNA